VRIYARGSEVPVEPGDTILSALRRAEKNIHSICGGRGMCGTCRVAVDEDFLALLPPPSFAETRLLRVLKAGAANHRLACQTILNAEHDGLRISPDPPPTRSLLQQENQS
jgi:ferredoxin